MLRRTLLVTPLALAACAAPSVNNTKPGLPVTPEATADTSQRAFDVQLYRELAREPGNQFASPYSVSSAFALVYPGARGETATEIADVFRWDHAQATANTAATARAVASNLGGSTFTNANAAWVERTFALLPDYMRAVRDTLGATIEPVDFLRNQAAALRQINQWAARSTNNRITEVLTDQNPDRRLVLTNAVYFNGKWSAPFRASGTRDEPFHAVGGDVPARLMHQTARFRYFEAPTFQAAEFDYDQGAFALDVFLPKQSSSLAAFELELSGQRLDGWLNQLNTAEYARLNLTLPKVEMRANYQLNEPLQQMGIQRSFSGAADFQGISQTPLMISQVIHKTFLRVDEEGTEAAAVTGIDMALTSAPMPPPVPPIEFRADRPFFIVLRHKPTNTIAFMGRIATV